MLWYDFDCAPEDTDGYNAAYAAWIINAAYGSTDQAIPPAGTKVRCYSYGNFDDDKFYKDIVADGNQTLDDYFGWDLEYIGNIGDTFIIHQYAGMH